MAYGIKYRCTQKSPSNQGGNIYVIEILENGFAGSVTDVRGSDEVFKLHYDQLDPEEPLKNPIQKARLEFFLQVKGQGVDADLGYDGQSILNEIFAADEDQFRMRLKIDGTVFWTGKVLPGFLEYPNGEYTYSGTIVAKDLTSLSGTDFPLTDDRVTIITTIADLLDDLGLGLDIYTYTSWVEQHVTATVGSTNYDFLNRIYNERKALREFAHTGDETDQPITLEDALNKVLKNYRLILRQAGGAWRIYQLSELEDPTTVHEFQYDSTGTQTGVTLSKDISVDVDRVSRFILPAGTNQINDGVKEVKGKYDHRTQVSGFLLPSDIVLDSSNQGPESFTRFFISDGSQELNFTTEINARWDIGVTWADVRWELKIGPYWWDNTQKELIKNTQVVNETDLTILDETATFTDSLGTIRINVPDIPSDADGAIEVILYRAQGDATNQETRWRLSSLDIVNPIALQNSQSINYQLTQSGNYSKIFKVGDTWFGDGPVGYAVSALRYSSNNGDTTSDSWQRRGSTSYRNFHENLFKEKLDLYRASTRNFQGDMLGDYSPVNVAVHNSANLFFLGGTLSGKSSTWDSYFLEITVNTATDIFEDIPKFTNETGSGSGTSSSSGGGGSNAAWNSIIGKPSTSGEWRTETGFDSVYAFDDLSNVDPATGQSALNLVPGTDVQAHDPQLDTLASFTATQVGHLASIDQDLGQADSVIFGGAQFNGDVTVDGNITQNGQAYINYAQQIKTTKDFIIQREGATGAIAGGAIAGSKVIKADGTNNVIFGTGNDAVMRVGWEGGTLQAIMTREDSPTDGGIHYWDNANSRSTTASDFTFDGTLRVPSIDTGQGANELYPMNQDVRTGANVTFETQQLYYQNTETTDYSPKNAGLRIYNNAQDDSVGIGSSISFETNYLGSGSYRRTSRAIIVGGTNNTGNTADGFLAFYTDERGAFTPKEAMRIDHDQRVMIGTQNPEGFLFNVNGTGNFGGLLTAQGGIDIKLASSFVHIDNSDETLAGIQFRDSQDPTGQYFQMAYHSGNNTFQMGRDGATDSVLIDGLDRWTFSSLLTAQDGAAVTGGDLDVTNNATIGGTLDVTGLTTLTEANIDTLRTTLFKPNSVSGMGGEFIFNGTTKVVSIDTGANTITVEDPVLGNGDAIVVSSMVGDAGFSKIWLDITSAGTGTGPTTYSYSVNGSSPGLETDIEAGYTAVKVNENLIYVNANEGVTNAPFIEGYNGVSGFDLLDGTATPNWYIRNNEIAVGSVFSADGVADTGTLAGANFDAGAQWAGGTKANATFFNDWSNQTLEVGDPANRVFVANGLDNTGRLASGYFDQRYAWWPKPGAADPTDPTALSDIGVRIDSNTGQIYSDAIVKSVYNRVNVAGFNSGDVVTAPTSSTWKETIQGIGGGQSLDTGYKKKLSGKVYKRFGLNTLFISGYSYESSTGDLIFTNTTRYVRISIGGVTKDITISTGNFETTLDISSLSEGVYYPSFEIRITGQTDNSGVQNTGSKTMHLREDVDFQLSA